jgi:hypothetical protein
LEQACEGCASSAAQQVVARQLLRPDIVQDAALKRLVETSTQKVHLICDRTHQLLAVSRARQADWRVDAGELLGRSLLNYASPEILAAEATLPSLGWHHGELRRLAIDTGANGSSVVPIVPGRVLWERIILADGSAARLVTMIA